MRMMGMWGKTDPTVPPISETDNIEKTEGSQGWYYTAWDKVMSDWTLGNNCTGNGLDPIEEEDWGIGEFGNKLSCTQGCSEKQNGDRVVGCLFNGGHVCYK